LRLKRRIHKYKYIYILIYIYIYIYIHKRKQGYPWYVYVWIYHHHLVRHPRLTPLPPTLPVPARWRRRGAAPQAACAGICIYIYIYINHKAHCPGTPLGIFYICLGETLEWDGLHLQTILSVVPEHAEEASLSWEEVALSERLFLLKSPGVVRTRPAPKISIWKKLRSQLLSVSSSIIFLAAETRECGWTSMSHPTSSKDSKDTHTRTNMLRSKTRKVEQGGECPQDLIWEF
jgi:hypothetical protein